MKITYLLFVIITVLLSGACTKQDHNGEKIKASIIKANEELLNKGNVNYADEVFSDDYEGGGPDVINKFVTEVRTAFPDLKVQIDPILVEGNITGWRRVHTGTHKSEYLGFAPSGKTISWESIILSQFVNGKISKEWGRDNLVEVLYKLQNQ